MIVRTSFGGVRPYSIDDLPALVRHANNRKVWLNLRDAFPHPYTDDHGRRFIEVAAKQDPTTYFAIATEQELIGAIGIVIGKDVHRYTAEMGYWLAEPFWGRGYMTEAVRAFSDWCFDTFGLMRIHAEPYSSNPASCRVLEKAGFAFEGRLRCNAVKDGQALDSLMYARVSARAPA